MGNVLNSVPFDKSKAIEEDQKRLQQDIIDFYENPVTSKLALDRASQMGDNTYGFTVSPFPFDGEGEFLIDEEYIQYLLKGITLGDPVFGVTDSVTERTLLLRPDNPEYKQIVVDVGFLNVDSTIRQDRPNVYELYGRILSHPVVLKYLGRHKEDINITKQMLEEYSK